MADFKKRFTRQEFVKELKEHLESVPTEAAHRGLIQKNAEHKANKYTEALRLLDQVSATLAEVASKTEDPSLKKKAEASIKQVDDAINTYGETSLDFNSVWYNYED